MASTRPSKPPRKSGPDSARRTAWSGPRASPTFAPSSSSPRPPASASTPQQGPSPAQTNGARPADPARDHVLQSLAGLTGTTVTLTTKTGVRYEGVVGSTSSEGDTTGVTLKDAKDITTPGAPLKDSFFIASTNIESYTSGPADAKPANGDTFRTDTDISQKKLNQGRERELQAWQPDNDAPSLAGDDETFGPTTGGIAWDQFAANEQLFGVTGSFNEEEYTTKLDRNAAGFKERELEAQRIAAEILGAVTNNPHVREERGLDDSSANEEDKYGAVVRGQGAYIPPGARRGPTGALSPPSISVGLGATKQEVPKVSVNGPDGATVAQTQTPPDKTASPVPGGTATPKDALPAFRDFVTTEKQRLTRKRQALVKSEMDKRMAELVKFSQNFKLNKPIPDDLVPILAKDEDKQRAIKEKAKKDSESNSARAIGASTAVTASRGVGIGGGLKGAMKQPSGGAPAPGASGLQKPPVSQQPSSTSTAQIASSHKPAGPTASKSETAVKKIPMYIQPIPAFKGSRPKQNSTPSATTASASAVIGNTGVNGSATPATATTTATTSPAPVAATPASPTTASSMNRLNVNASSFRPTMKNAVQTPTTVASPKSKADAPAPNSAAVVNNPFFGVRPLKKSSVTHIKDDFNPFKYGKVLEVGTVAPNWPYHGKRYAQMFPAIPHPPPGHPSHMGSGPNTPGNAGGNAGGPPVQQHVPPPPYEEDPNAQAAAAAAAARGGGYVYPYPPYAYPGQPMMHPPGPPGAYMPPFMHPMPYPPGMPPPNAMYSPALGQMPPYMPPPPGPYPPPPNGAAPRPSMPPTPIPAQAHPYYHHQSPQLQHAVPYMMMPPPPTGVPHPYENGPPPPVQMGGHA